MTFITEISNKYKELTKEFFIWYNTKYKYPLSSFISLPEIMQFGVITEYIIDKYNMSYHCDSGSYYIFWYDPELSVNEMLKVYNESGQFSIKIEMKSGLKIVNHSESNKRVILRIFDMITNPF